MATEEKVTSLSGLERFLNNIKNENGVEKYMNKILSDIKKSKNKLKEINDKINADKQ